MKKDSDTLTCTYKYSDGTSCNRPLTRGFKDKEGEQYCIFHTRDDEKLQELKQEMQNEISTAANLFKKEIKTQNLSEDNEDQKDKIAELRSKYALNYEGAYFPDSFDLFNYFALEVGISFNKAVFSGVVYFREATFSGEAHFWEATFNGGADFDGATFSGEANFLGATFSGKANFCGATFSGEANFLGATFSGEADFQRATFSDEANFSGATFSGEASFFKATFSYVAGFSWVTFSREAYFSGATFSGEAEFTDVLFIANTFFAGCELDKGELKFLDTAFFSTGSFQDISEGSNIIFINCCFSGVSFLRSRIADTVFSNCGFNMTEGWINKKIQKINNKLLSNRIPESEAERLNQRSSLLKQEKDKIDELKRKNKRLLKKNLLLEHRSFLERPHFKLLMRKLSRRGLKIISSPLLHLFPHKFNFIRKILNSLNEKSYLMDFGEVKDNYMQLKVNMDRMKDYALANDFYNGEMEMKRLGEKLYKPKRWFLALYKFLSGYGNRPGQAVGVFVLLMALFSLPLFFDLVKIRKDINYGSMLPQTERKIEKDSFYSVLMNPLFIISPDLKANYEKKALQNVLNIDDVPDRNVLDFLSICSFNITAISNIYKPTYIASNEWSSYYLGFVHYFIRPVQIALIILAIRRKVKRGEE